MTKITHTDVTFGSAWLNRRVAYQDASHSAGPSDTQANEMLRSPPNESMRRVHFLKSG